MSILDIFRKKSDEERFRMAIRRNLETFVVNMIKEYNNRFPPVDTEIAIPKAIDEYMETVKSSKEFIVISVKTMMTNAWDPYLILAEEKQRVLDKFKYGK